MKVLGVIVHGSLFLGLAAAAPGLRGGEEDIGEVHAETAPTRNLADSTAEVGEKQDEVLADTFPDISTGLDVPGPYTEEPNEADAKSPKTAIRDWENATSLQATAFNTWGQSFCEAHHTGFFCDRTTRVRCCRKTWGYVKCGTTYHSTSCGWPSGNPYNSPSIRNPGDVLNTHSGWYETSFCRSHHTGFFCFSHHKVHCCYDYGHYVDCSTSSDYNWRC